MKVAFRADGGSEIGLGHLMRCSVLAEKFIEKGGNVKFYCHHTKQQGINWLRMKGFETIPLMQEDLKSEARELSQHVKSLETDILFIDSYWLNDDYFKIAKSSGCIVAVIDDEELYSYDCDIIINCSLGAEKRKYDNSKCVLKLLGGKYSILRNEFMTAYHSEFNGEIKKIFVTMGGSDVNNFTPRVLEGIANIPDIDITVIYGPLMKSIEDIKKAAAKCLGNVKIYENPSNIAELMSMSDLAISAAGGTARELFALGVVSLFAIQAENQIFFWDYLKSLNLPLCLGYHTEITALSIYKTVRNLINRPEKVIYIKEQISGLVDRNGTNNIINEIENFFHA